MRNSLKSLAWAVALAFGMFAGCTSLPPEPPPTGAKTAAAPRVKAGDYWEFAVRDVYTGSARGLLRFTVSRVDADRVIVDLTRDGERIDTHIYTPDWHGLEHPLRNLQRFRYTPSYPAYAFPMYPGQGWRSVFTSTDPTTGRSYRSYVISKVGGWHRIKVPAGEFDALEVRRAVFAGNAEFFRLQEEIVETDWYAPSVGFTVLSEGTSSHIDTSRGGGGRRDPPLRMRGEWLRAALVRFSTQP